MKIHYELVEMMVFYWEQVAAKEKVRDAYLTEMAEMPEMKPVYNDEFTKDSFRKVLSAISNKELLSAPTKAESRFWNLNMWMLEDPDHMRAMVNRVKQLNLDDVEGESELYFIPGHLDEVYRNGADVLINFFKIMVSDGDAKISGEDFETFVRGQLNQKE